MSFEVYLVFKLYYLENPGGNMATSLKSINVLTTSTTTSSAPSTTPSSGPSTARRVQALEPEVILASDFATKTEPVTRDYAPLKESDDPAQDLFDDLMATEERNSLVNTVPRLTAARFKIQHKLSD